MLKSQLANKNIAKWLIVCASMVGVLYLLFFLLLVLNQKTLTLPAPPDSASFPTPTSTSPPSQTPTAIPSPVSQGKFCGGIAGIQCPTGLMCKLDGNYPDAGGTCIKKGI